MFSTFLMEIKPSDIVKYEVFGDTATLTFREGFELRLSANTYTRNACRFEYATLRRSGRLEAIAIERDGHLCTPPDNPSGYWSRGKIQQQQLAEYMDAAVAHGLEDRDKELKKPQDKHEPYNKILHLWEILNTTYMTRNLLRAKGFRKLRKKDIPIMVSGLDF